MALPLESTVDLHETRHLRRRDPSVFAGCCMGAERVGKSLARTQECGATKNGCWRVLYLSLLLLWSISSNVLETRDTVRGSSGASSAEAASVESKAERRTGVGELSGDDAGDACDEREPLERRIDEGLLVRRRLCAFSVLFLSSRAPPVGEVSRGPTLAALMRASFTVLSNFFHEKTSPNRRVSFGAPRPVRMDWRGLLALASWSGSGISPEAVERVRRRMSLLFPDA